jgi:hypothetical protein
MTYTTRKPSTGTVAALGSTFDDVMSTVKQMGGAIDSYLPEALCRVDQLRALRKDRSPVQALFGKKPTVPVPVCYKTPPGQKGVGVVSAMKPLRGSVYIYEHPTLVWVGLTAVFAVPFLAGFLVGRKTK